MADSKTLTPTEMLGNILLTNPSAETLHHLLPLIPLEGMDWVRIFKGYTPSLSPQTVIALIEVTPVGDFSESTKRECGVALIQSYTYYADDQRDTGSMAVPVPLWHFLLKFGEKASQKTWSAWVQFAAARAQEAEAMGLIAVLGKARATIAKNFVSG